MNVGTRIAYWVRSLGYRLDVPAFCRLQGHEIFLFPRISRPALELTQSPVHRFRGLFPRFPRGNRQGHEFGHILPPNAKVKNGRSYKFTLLLLGVDRDSITLQCTCTVRLTKCKPLPTFLCFSTNHHVAALELYLS
jgi:hypothetical protein